MQKVIYTPRQFEPIQLDMTWDIPGYVPIDQRSTQPVEEIPVADLTEETVREVQGVTSNAEDDVKDPTSFYLQSRAKQAKRGKTTYKSTDIDPGNLRDLLTKFEDAGISLRVTSGKRSGAKTSNGSQSWHATGDAIDVTPGEGETWDSLITKMRNTPTLLDYMRNSGYGILDERSSEMLARTGGSGAHWHIGKDKSAIKEFKTLFGQPGFKFPLLDNSNANFVKRLKDPNRKSIKDYEDPNSIATHKMSWATVDGNEIVFPTVQEINGQLIDFNDPKNKQYGDALDNALKNKDFVVFPNGTADWFTKNYKRFYKFKKGGKNRFNSDVPNITDKIIQEYQNEQRIKSNKIEDAPLVPLTQEIVSWLPGAGDAIETGNIVSQIANKDFTNAAVNLGLLLIPGNAGNISKKLSLFDDSPLVKRLESGAGERIGLTKEQTEQILKEFKTQELEIDPNLDQLAKYNSQTNKIIIHPDVLKDEEILQNVVTHERVHQIDALTNTSPLKYSSDWKVLKNWDKSSDFRQRQLSSNINDNWYSELSARLAQLKDHQNITDGKKHPTSEEWQKAFDDYLNSKMPNNKMSYLKEKIANWKNLETFGDNVPIVSRFVSKPLLYQQKDDE